MSSSHGRSTSRSVSPPGMFSKSSAVAGPSRVSSGSSSSSPWPGEMQNETPRGSAALDPVVQAGAEAALRAVVRGLLGPALEHAADAAAPDRDDDEVVVARDPLDVGGLGRRADDELAAALEEVLRQPRQVDPVVDAHRRVVEVALERDVRAVDEVVVAGVAVLGDVPVVHAERALALERVVVVRHRVQQLAVGDLLRASCPRRSSRARRAPAGTARGAGDETPAPMIPIPATFSPRPCSGGSAR